MPKPKHILLIEDDQLTVEVYEKAFENSGLKLECLTDAESVLEKIKAVREGKKEKPDLILLDLLLPNLENGLFIFKEIKKIPQTTKSISLFILTNYPDFELSGRLVKEGADKFLFKTDYTPYQLVELVKEALK